ncbi:SDR family NAD(P)-dependent oxidoreductase [Paenibacillus piri]|uniref:SDR family oxidoreductase n=1 Tax=Paenibacillus piri TaxID=2547395 RepID=A0A4R5KGJ8_9BACL|nr:SDR family oxidoreductase [Paenibacillus piri]TDF93825.1 SDR family oxidoreductase [Paenibacillus piri]
MKTAAKVALITGAGRGIGAATAKELAASGIKVAVNYLSGQESAERVVSDILRQGGEAVKVQGDVCEADQVARITDEIVDRWGQIDIMVSNAHIPFAVKPFLDLTWPELSQKLNREIQAAYNLSQAILPIMKQNGYGRIVYVASGVAKNPGIGFMAHGTAKAALVQFAKFIAQEFGEFGITANVISPGAVQTEASRAQLEKMSAAIVAATPVRRIAQPEDIAKAIALYASEQSGFITGSYVPVNGGKDMV